MRRRVVTLVSVSALALALSASPASASSQADHATHVWPGHSIQAAIDHAPAGGVIIVERGTYRGNLEIKRSVRLVGHNAVIKPATSPTDNICVTLLGGGVPGICVHGAFNADGSIKKAISNVSIEGFTVRNFGSAGILAAGVNGFRAVRNVTAHNGSWGMLVSVVSNLSLLYNRSHDNGSDGIQVGDSPSANAVIVGNKFHGNLGAGIVFRDSLGGRLTLNTLHDNCAGIVVADTGAPGASGNVSVELNQVTANNRLCPAVPGEAPAYGGVGIALIGVQNTTVALNDIRNNLSQTGSSFSDGGGILMVNGAIFGADPPSGDSVRLNWLSGNTPNDIYGDGTGTLNTVTGNTCTTTNLTGAC